MHTITRLKVHVTVRPGSGGTYHSEGEVVEEVVVAFGRNLLVGRGGVDLHLKHTADCQNDIKVMLTKTDIVPD